jgi:hypothetical protein
VGLPKLPSSAVAVWLVLSLLLKVTVVPGETLMQAGVKVMPAMFTWVVAVAVAALQVMEPLMGSEEPPQARRLEVARKARAMNRVRFMSFSPGEPGPPAGPEPVTPVMAGC